MKYLVKRPGTYKIVIKLACLRFSPIKPLTYNLNMTLSLTLTVKSRCMAFVSSPPHLGQQSPDEAVQGNKTPIFCFSCNGLPANGGGSAEQATNFICLVHVSWLASSNTNRAFACNLWWRMSAREASRPKSRLGPAAGSALMRQDLQLERPDTNLAGCRGRLFFAT
jgi:hypothetical protein